MLTKNTNNKTKKRIGITGTLLLPIILGGCLNMSSTANNDDTKPKAETTKTNTATNNENNEKSDYLVSVQDYTGQGYKLPKGEKTDKIAEANKDEITKAVKQFFLDKYKTEVKVHNLVGAVDGASVFVESVGEPHFHTFCIVPIDLKTKKVKTSDIWTQEGQVEGSILSGVYAMIYEDKLKNLDKYLNEITSKYPVVGTRQEAINNVFSTGYTTPYYYITILDDNFETLFDKYLQNPKMTQVEWKQQLNSIKIDPEGFTVTIQLFMKEPAQKPDKQIFNTVVSDLEKMNNLSPANYCFYLNDNYIDKESAYGSKENSLERAYPNDILKK